MIQNMYQFPGAQPMHYGQQALYSPVPYPITQTQQSIPQAPHPIPQASQPMLYFNGQYFIPAPREFLIPVPPPKIDPTEINLEIPRCEPAMEQVPKEAGIVQKTLEPNEKESDWFKFYGSSRSLL